MSAGKVAGQIIFPWNTAVQNADTIADYVGGNRGLGRVVTGAVNATVHGALGYKAAEESLKQGDKLIGSIQTGHYGDAVVQGVAAGLFAVATTQMAAGMLASARSMFVNEKKYGAEAND